MQALYIKLFAVWEGFLRKACVVGSCSPTHREGVLCTLAMRISVGVPLRSRRVHRVYAKRTLKLAGSTGPPFLRECYTSFGNPPDKKRFLRA